jgi:membrane protease YdiL (CAAX protease family)
MTCLAHGLAGLRELVARALKWQVGGRWYAIALFAAPVLALATCLALIPFSPEFVPSIAIVDDKTSAMLLGLAVALTAGVFEELGWTGFAIPKLRRRYGVITTGLILGLMWSAWHVLVVVWGIGNRAGTISLPLFVLLDGLTALVAFRVLMVWVYDRTGSLLIAMLMHVSLTASTLVLWPLTTGARLITHDVVFAGAVWLVVAVIALASSGQLTPWSMRRRIA